MDGKWRRQHTEHSGTAAGTEQRDAKFPLLAAVLVHCLCAET